MRMQRMMKNIKLILEESTNKACDEKIEYDEEYQVDIRSKQK